MKWPSITEEITSYLVTYNFISRYKDIKYIGTRQHSKILLISQATCLYFLALLFNFQKRSYYRE